MTLHFIRRDFLTYKFFWILLILFSVICVPLLSEFRELWLALICAYFMFGISSINNLVGVTWRSQHVMSRNYLLSLPLARNKMYFIVLSRVAIFWIPFLFLIAYLPYFLRVYFGMWVPLNYISFVLTVAILAAWCVNAMISVQLTWEKITSHLTQAQRFKAGVIAIGLYIAEVCLAVYFLKLAVLQKSPDVLAKNGPLLPVALALTLTVTKMISCRRKWLGIA